MFKIGVSSGIFAAIPEQERAQYASLAKKAEYSITKGVQFVQIDLESVSEFKSPNLKDEIERVKKLGIEFGIHSETKAFGVEVAELDSAIETDYKFGHERLRDILENAGNIESKYVLIHSSESEPFLLLERHMQPTSLVDFFGNTLREFLEKNSFLIEWLIGGKEEEVSNRIFDEWIKKEKAITAADIGKAVGSQEYLWRELIGYSFGEIMRMEIERIRGNTEVNARTKFEDFSDKDKKLLHDLIKTSIPVELRSWLSRFLETIQSRSLHYGPERVAYYFTAKWMEHNNDPLWSSIVNASIRYFASVEGKTADDWLKEKGIKEKSIDDENFRRLYMIWVPAISAKYIWGHLNQDKNPIQGKYPDLKPTIKKYKMPLVLETPMAHRGIEEWLRFPNPLQMYYLAKQVNDEAGFECIILAMDFEHMISIKLEPEKVIENLPEDGGDFVRVLHVGYPAPLAPAHIPIPFGSEQQFYLYKMMYLLKRKGFGNDKNDFFIVFERGGGVDPVQQSIIALRVIVDFLKKDVKPEEIQEHPEKYKEFWGIDITQIGAIERQRVNIREHAYDPLKGLMAVPEEEHGFLGKSAVEKGKGEEWRKEKYR